MGKAWIVTAGDDRPLREIADDLARAGLKIKRVLDEVGAIVGVGDESAVERFRKVRGVIDVAPDQSVGVGPPDADETW